MRSNVVLASLGGAALMLVVHGGAFTQAQNSQPAPSNALRVPGDFASIQDQATRSKALFMEAAKVIMHPRCMNCHPATDRPLQGNDQHLHQPPVSRGEGGVGIAGNNCATCHGERNFRLHEKASYQSIPGHPRWGLAPIEMAWEGKTVGQICQQLKDKSRNGDRDLAMLHEHIAKDDLVGWGWDPGPGREPAPGTQARTGELIQAWIDTGAQCP